MGAAFGGILAAVAAEPLRGLQLVARVRRRS